MGRKKVRKIERKSERDRDRGWEKEGYKNI